MFEHWLELWLIALAGVLRTTPELLRSTAGYREACLFHSLARLCDALPIPSERLV